MSEAQEKKISDRALYTLLLLLAPVCITLLGLLIGYIWLNEKASREQIKADAEAAIDKVSMEVKEQFNGVAVQIEKTNGLVATMREDFVEVKTTLKNLLQRDIPTKDQLVALRSELLVMIEAVRREQDMRTGRLDAVEKLLNETRERVLALEKGK